MLDIYDELVNLVTRLEAEGIDYALCGGLAMAVYRVPRATKDIDILTSRECLPRVKAIAHGLGYTIDSGELVLADGDIEIHRLLKAAQDADALMMLDILVVTPVLAKVWESRRKLQWQHGIISVVSRDGLIRLKSFRRSGQDMDDIKLLKGQEDED
jgi:hypothetical protein